MNVGYTTTNTISALAYNLGLGAAITHVFLWNWTELKEGLYCLSHKRTTFDHRFKLKPSGDSNSCNLARRSMTHIIEVCSFRLRSATLQLMIIQKCGSIVKSHNGMSLWRAAPHLGAEPVSRWYLTLFVVSLGVGIGCLYGSGTSQPLMPWWSVLLFTALSAFFAVFLGFSESASSLRSLYFLITVDIWIVTATTGFNISVKGAIQILAAFIHPGKPM